MSDPTKPLPDATEAEYLEVLRCVPGRVARLWFKLTLWFVFRRFTCGNCGKAFYRDREKLKALPHGTWRRFVPICPECNPFRQVNPNLASAPESA